MTDFRRGGVFLPLLSVSSPEKAHLNRVNKPKFYLRHVDVILAAFDNEQATLNFQNFLNSRHPNIKFTVKKHINHSIASLDVFISGINNQNLTL